MALQTLASLTIINDKIMNGGTMRNTFLPPALHTHTENVHQIPFDLSHIHIRDTLLNGWKRTVSAVVGDPRRGS